MRPPDGLDPGTLDPADAAPTQRALVLRWLALQRTLAWRPREAARVLAADPLLTQICVTRDDEGARAALAERGARGLPLGSPRYPERLARLADAAPLLWVEGSPDALLAPGVAIVGPRAPTEYGRSVARALARALAGAGIVVISGLARGIDAEAHEGALEAGGRTVAFQGCGPDQVYPAQHRALAARIAASGALASEFAPGVPPLPAHFPLRNRLISALAHAVVVIEAREQSGSLVTARHAADQGVELLAVPGPIDAPTSRGTNRLLRDGARMLLDVRDVLDAIGVRGAPPAPAAAGDGLSPLARTLLASLAEAPADRDGLCRRLLRPPEALASALLELELAERIREDRDGRLRVVRDPFAAR